VRKIARPLLLLAACVLAVAAQASDRSAEPVDPAEEAERRHPLDPLDLSSPRATIESFFLAVRGIDATYRRFRDDPSQETQSALNHALRRATRCFDLGQVPEAARPEVGPDTVILMAEVLSRIRIPPLRRIPGEAAFAHVPLDEPARWTLPHTEIMLTRVQDGPRSGQFLFSADTVARLPTFYAVVEDLPVLHDRPVGQVRKLQLELGGWMVSPAWIEAAPPVFRRVVLDQAVWKWLALGSLFLLLGGVVLGIHRLARRRPWDDTARGFFARLAAPLVLLGLLPVVRWLAAAQVSVTGSVAEAVSIVVVALSYLAGAWVLWLLSRGVGSLLMASPRVNRSAIDAHLVRLGSRVLGFVAATALLFKGGDQLGIPLYGLLAGLGVGSLAIALAAQSTFENFVGSLNLYADRPLKVGDFCRYGDDMGIIEEIGLRSTRVRGIDRTITTIPNAELSRTRIVNYSRRDRMLFKTMLDLRYETTPEQLRFLLTRLRELLLAHPRVLEDPARARFVGCGDFALQVEIFAYVATDDFAEFLTIQEDLLLRIMDVVREAGTGFALPSQTSYLARDAGVDAERTAAAEQAVEAWRNTGRLPFPDLADEHRKTVRDTLDFPPRGSVASGNGGAPPASG